MPRSKSEGKKEGRKRVRSKNSSGKDGKKRRSSETEVLNESFTEKSKVSQNPGSTPVLTDTPKGKLAFDELDNDTPNQSSTVLANAPSWAQELMDKLVKVETIANNTQKSIDGVLKSNVETTTKVNLLTKKVNLLEVENQQIKSKNEELEEKVLLLEYHQRRNNLLFDGIPEVDGRENGRDCYNKLLHCLGSIKSINPASVPIDRCHRVGPRIKNKTRSIIARFNWYGDLTKILEHKSELPSGVFVSEDFPEEWQERRRMLRPLLNCAKQIDKYKDSSLLVRDKLIIDGKQYTVAPRNNLCELPKDIVPSSTCERKDSSTIAFLGPHSVFSNFHPAPFVESNVKYTCTEQMIQAEKAVMFNDKQSLEKVMKATSPFKMKELGSRIRNFDKNTWEANRRKIVTRAVHAKFKQNKSLGKLLQSTGSLLIVEASRDPVWGTGIHLKDDNVLNCSMWKGNGIMSEILAQVRESLAS